MFIYRNQFKKLPVITVALLSFILTGFPAAGREKGGIAGCTEGIVRNSSLFFCHIHEGVIIADVLIVSVVVTTDANALFPHKINISVCVCVCVYAGGGQAVL